MLCLVEPTATDTQWRFLGPLLSFGDPPPAARYSVERQSDAVLFAWHSNLWKNETLCESSVEKIVNHPSYQFIIKMGERALPHIFTELDVEPDHWFYALWKITKADPVPPEACGDVQAMADAWLEWAKQNNKM